MSMTNQNVAQVILEKYNSNVAFNLREAITAALDAKDAQHAEELKAKERETRERCREAVREIGLNGFTTDANDVWTKCYSALDALSTPPAAATVAEPSKPFVPFWCSHIEVADDGETYRMIKNGKYMAGPGALVQINKCDVCGASKPLHDATRDDGLKAPSTPADLSAKTPSGRLYTEDDVKQKVRAECAACAVYVEHNAADGSRLAKELRTRHPSPVPTWQHTPTCPTPYQWDDRLQAYKYDHNGARGSNGAAPTFLHCPGCGSPKPVTEVRK